MIDQQQKLEVPAALVHWVFNFKVIARSVFEWVTYSHQCLVATHVRLTVVFRVYMCTLYIQMIVGVLIHRPNV